MASNACCAAGAPVRHDYEPTGAITEVDGVKYYFVGSGAAGVVIVTDIFGFDYKQVFQVADRFAAAGFNVAVPDMFYGKPWSMDRMPPKPEDNLPGWFATDASYAKVGPIVASSVELLKGKGAAKFGCIGFCWGVSIAMAAAAGGTFSAVGGAHPSLFGKDAELASTLPCPVILLPAKGDADVAKVKGVMDATPYGPKCVYQRFDDQVHGFVAARGDWDKPEVAAAATQAINLMTDFLRANVLL